VQLIDVFDLIIFATKNQYISDHQGLGFSLTTNDAASGDLPGPLYVQEILNNGPAMKNGKLLIGDK